uniref:BTB domain-containing protein n=1 Tax=Leersia perrieri TaxID=77586 RepID=A0A0D9X5J2_9ORYZ
MNAHPLKQPKESIAFVLELKTMNATVQASYKVKYRVPGRLWRLWHPMNNIAGVLFNDDKRFETIILQDFEKWAATVGHRRASWQAARNKDGADVNFSNGGVIFAAHKIVLAMRSPVFQALLCLCGKMMEARMPCVTIDDVQPDVFRALLHFVYIDSLPDMGDLQGDVQ